MSPISAALGGLRRADEALVAAVEAVNSGSLDLNSMAEAAALLKGAEIQAGASLAVLRTSVEMDRHFIDILA
ncbi:MAG: hypothetical protein OJJ21_20220 [Ferrovibrio sp.]|uniref:hypothetical protein n=1 Tax=Ferrovibrio sp. TaxID=1917215 RepID=UPI00260B7B0A|nr:hypothetical protein [Ferrovibrio sp.]MCW0235934.1 hypothetical protein [Ferrovibrio sp.]